MSGARAAWLIALALAAAGCSEPAAPPQGAESSSVALDPASPVPAEPEQRPGVPLAGLADLTGEWRVAGVDGLDINQPEGISASVSGGKMVVTAGCVRWQWSVTLEAGAFAATPATQVTPVCARGLTPAEAAMAEAIGSATSARRLPSKGVELSGNGRSVLLFSQ